MFELLRLMVMVGGGIIVHGLDAYGVSGLAHLIHDAAETTAHAIPVLASVLNWIVEAAGAGVVGIVAGLIAIPVTGYAISPMWRYIKSLLPHRRRKEALADGKK